MPRKPAIERTLCYVHDEVEIYDVDEIRKNVCENGLDNSLIEHTDGKYYCLLHLPTKEKNLDKFEGNFRTALFSVRRTLAKINDLPKNKQEKAKDKVFYDFRYVYFPDYVDLREYEFEVNVDFSSATFLEGCNFKETVFSSSATFQSTKFLSYADFSNSFYSSYADFSSAVFSFSSFGNAIFTLGSSFSSSRFSGSTNFREALFSAETHFRNAVFDSDVYFREAIFTENVYFSSAQFLGDTYFSLAIFCKDVYFRSSKFLEKSEIFFHQTKFCKIVDFRFAVLSGYMGFTGKGIEKAFLNKKDVIKVRKELEQKFNSLRDELIKSGKEFQIPNKWEENQESLMDFQNIRLGNPEGISFHRVRLCPNWFINSDVRKIVFIDVSWINLDSTKKNDFINAELKSLNVRGIFDGARLFTITCRQLAENAENNNRFEEASDFRRMAMEIEWLVKKKKISDWTEKIVLENEKLKRRFGNSTNEEDSPILPTTSFGIFRRGGDFIIHFLYRITSFYGESWSWAMSVLAILIFLIFPFIYTQIEFQISPKNIPLEVVVKDCADVVKELKSDCKIENRYLEFWNEAIPHSLASASLQTIEYRIPKTTWGDIWVILEKIIAPLQVALLALAIRRKFMR